MAEEIIRKKKKKKEEGAPEYMVTYGDMMSLLLTFFIMLLTPARIDGQELRLILANFPGLGNMLGGFSFNEGPLPYSGQIQEALPSIESGRALNKDRKVGTQIFSNTLTQNNIESVQTEKGLVISLPADSFFEKYSANLNLEDNLEYLRNLAGLIRNFITANPDVNFRIEGFSDELVLPSGSLYTDEWGLSSARALSLLRFFEQFAVPLDNASVSGLGNTRSRFLVEGEITGSSLNRRVDIIILNEGNL